LTDDLEVVITIDSYTVKPIFFPGGDIGKLAATGSINDVVVLGAKPLAVMDAIVVEEGFPLDRLEKILESMSKVMSEEGVALIGGDFKVMPKEQVDEIVITTTAIGVVRKEHLLSMKKVSIGDKLIVTGPIGLHGATILALQSGISVEEIPFKSDVAPLTKAIHAALKVGGLHKAKDMTRGGLAMALNEIANATKATIIVNEEDIPVVEEVRSYTEMLGVDLYSLASEGCALLIVSPEKAEDIVDELHKIGYSEAKIIGEIVKGKAGYVLLKTMSGGLRILEPPTGEIVPRIC